jgi:hypothetical protein
MENGNVKSTNNGSTWAHVVYSGTRKYAEHTTPVIIIMSNRKGTSDEEATIAVRVCDADGPRANRTIYLQAVPASEYGEGSSVLEAIGRRLEQNYNVFIGVVKDGLGKFARKLYSWDAVTQVRLQTNEDGTKRRAIIHVRHRFTNQEETFEGPWNVSSDDEVVRKVMFVAFNEAFNGFQHIEFNLTEQGFHQQLVAPRKKSPGITLETTEEFGQHIV